MLYMFHRLTSIERDIVCSQALNEGNQQAIIVGAENDNVQVILAPCNQAPQSSCSSLPNHLVMCEDISAHNDHAQEVCCNEQQQIEVNPPKTDDRCCALVCNPGKMTKNPFLNFVREFRKERCGRRQADIIKEAAEHWNKLPKPVKAEWVEAARNFKSSEGC